MCGNGAARRNFYTPTACGGLHPYRPSSAGQRVLHRVGDGLWQVEMGRFTAAPDAVGLGLGGGPLLDVPLCAGGRVEGALCSRGQPALRALYARAAAHRGGELAAWGRALGHHPAFPGGINVEFAQPISPTGLAVTVWERGSGATLACGTGACAVAAAAVLTGRCPRGAPILVQLPGGTLEVCTAGRHRAFDRRRRSNI